MSSGPSLLEKNTLFYGDNLQILRGYIQRESVDLIYLDPPFNSKETYNVLFKERGGRQSTAQIQAFSDFWHWDDASEKAYIEIQEKAPNVGECVKAFVSFLGRNDITAYLVMMGIRLIELHRVLRKTGSLYIHCDPTASHYLKVILDTIFDPRNFRNEIVWKRTYAHSGADHYGPIHDTLLFYTKSDEYVWHPKSVAYSKKYLDAFFKPHDEKGHYRLTLLTGSGTRNGSSGKPWRGVDPTKVGRHWAIPGYMRPQLGKGPFPDVQSALEALDAIGRIDWPEKRGGTPMFKQYQDDLGGVDLQDIWTDIGPIPSHSPKRLGYPTQKPPALLDRIIEASSDKGALVLDPFCGCGTTIFEANELGRRWIGIDITTLAISLIKTALRDMKVYNPRDYQIIGEPTTFSEAQALAKADKYQFQWWSLSLINAHLIGVPEGSKVGKKGADRGKDGYLTFKEGNDPNVRKIIVQAKGGENVDAGDVRDLVGTVGNAKAAMGVLIMLEEPTEPMQREARDAEYYESPTWGRKYPKIQIISVKELLDKRWPDIPLPNPSI